MNRLLNTEIVKQSGETVLIKGWVHARRDMGKIVFFDMRDRSGLLQVVCVPKNLDDETQELLKTIRPEWILSIEGVVQERGEKQINPDLPTGTVELAASKIEILSQAETPPFEVDKDTSKVDEELRLKHRYLDLRSERMAENIRQRARAMQFVRNYLTDLEGFTEVQTPILTKSTPEGARDYLVPSRKHQGKFFALPQSPQQYKQLLMVAGLERYFQIAPCFRDEDARADRSPGEFYQIDIEMSFVTQEDILQMTEKMFTALVKEVFPDKKIQQEPWPRLSHDEVMEKYGTDKPDLRQNPDDPDELAFAWVTGFPLFVEQTEEDHFHGAGDTFAPSHHMFTAPVEEDIPLLDSDPLKVKSYQHDLVLNGLEVGGGSIRIHDPAIQEKIFDLIGFTVEQKKEFSHLLEAFTYGVPPHGGIAPGFDRLISVLAGEPAIREIIAFPLLSDARDPLMNAPAKVNQSQLKELGIDIATK